MNKYRVLKPITLFSGVVGLSEAQFERRLHSRALEKTKTDGLYNVVGEVHLKAGEEFAGDIGKALLKSVEVLSDDKPESLTLKEVKAELDSLGVDYDKRAKKTDLLELLDEAKQ